MVLALGVARDLGAHDARGIAVLGAAHAADGARVESARPSSAHTLGQSCGQTEATMSCGIEAL